MLGPILEGDRVRLEPPARALFPASCASAASGARRTLTVRATASPISRMGTSVEDDWRESS